MSVTARIACDHGEFQAHVIDEVMLQGERVVDGPIMCRSYKELVLQVQAKSVMGMPHASAGDPIARARYVSQWFTPEDFGEEKE